MLTGLRVGVDVGVSGGGGGGGAADGGMLGLAVVGGYHGGSVFSTVGEPVGEAVTKSFGEAVTTSVGASVGVVTGEFVGVCVGVVGEAVVGEPVCTMHCHAVLPELDFIEHTPVNCLHKLLLLGL